MTVNKTPNDQLKNLKVAPIARADAKRIILSRHYMKTYPQGARLWVSDECGHNTESRVMGHMMRMLGKHGVRLVVTHAGGCKNDCGILYQACNWLYFGKEKCRDFYLTTKGEYRNLVAAMRFGRVTPKGKPLQLVAESLFGPGEVVESWRYLYMYPVDRGLRSWLESRAKPYPKDSARFRFKQQWVEPSK